MRRTLFIVLAIAAVLCGAPSPAFATDTSGEPARAGTIFEPFEIAIGIGGIGGIALFGCFALLVRRRRRVSARLSKDGDDSPATPSTAEEQVTAALHRRTLRRGHVRMDEDPIIASMGVGSPSRAEHGVSRAQRSARRSPPT